MGDVPGDCLEIDRVSCSGQGGGDIDGLLKKMKMSGLYKPQAWRWLNANPLANKSLIKVINKEKFFVLSHTPISLRYSHHANLQRIQRGDRATFASRVHSAITMFIGNVNPTFLPHKLDSVENIAV